MMQTGGEILVPQQQIPPQSLPRNVKLLGWASLLNDVASEMIFPLLPQFLMTSLGGTRLHLGMIEGVADSASSLLKLWAGAWSDRVGARKGFVVFGYALAAVARPLMALIFAPWQLFAARIADRIGKGVRTSPRDALVADSTPSEARGRAFGFQRAMDHLGAAVGPVLATAFLWFWPGQLRLLFLLTILPGLLVVGLLLFSLGEAGTTAPAGVKFSWTLAPFDRNFRRYLLALIVFTLGNSSDAFLLVRASDLGVSTPLLPLLWCAFHIVKSGGSMLAGRPIDKFGPGRLLAIGWLLYALIYLGFGVAFSAWHIWTLFLTYGGYYALTEPAEKTLVANLVGSERRGLAYGWFNFCIGIATLPSSLLFGFFYEEFGALLAFGCGAALALLATALLVGVRVR